MSRPYSQSDRGPKYPGTRQPYPSASQPAQRQPRDGRPPSASQPRSYPPPYSPVDTSTSQSPQYGAAPPSASQPRPSQGNPQKKKPRVAVSSGAPKPYQPFRQPGHTGPPARNYVPPSASQPRNGYPSRTPSHASTPRDHSPATTPGSTTPRSTTPLSPTPRAHTPTRQRPPSAISGRQPPSPHHSNNNLHYNPAYDQPEPVYKNPPPGDRADLIPSPGSDSPDDRWSKRSASRAQSESESDPSSRKTLPVAEKKDYPKKPTPSKQRQAPKPRPKKEKYRKLYGSQPCGGHCKLCVIVAIVFIVLLILALILGLSLSNRGVDYSGSFAMHLGEECDMMCVDPAADGYSRGAVLMIALDGFRPEFMNETWKDTIPNIHRLAECGSVATNMEPSYPSTTYPNLYSLVTGLYPGVHGVIADYMTGEGIPGTFNPRGQPESATLQNPSWYNGKPIWQTAKEQGVITGSHSWIGNNVDQQSIDGITVDPNPDYYVQRDPDISFLARIQSALNWFTMPRNKAKFVNIYMEEPGDTIRRHGVLSNQVKEALAEVDDAIGLFMENLFRDAATSCFDIVIVSTAGHLDVSCSNTTYFDDILQNTLHYDTTTNGMNSMAFLSPTPQSPTDSDTPEELVKNLGCGNNRPFEAYTRDTMPPEYRFFNPEREESAVVLMDDWHTYASSQESFDSDDCEGARGGYNPTNAEMKGVLIGFGPSFRKNYIRREGFTNVEVYNLISELIDITPAKNNGTHGVLNDLLVSPDLPLTEVENTKTYFGREGCTYPDTTAQLNQKKLLEQTGCTCTTEALSSLSPTVIISQKDELLDISQGQGDLAIRDTHSPLGEPKLIDVEGAIGRHHCRLFQTNYMTVFENKLRVPLFVSYEVKSESNSQTVSDCVRYDVRLDLEDSPKCSDYDIQGRNSLPQGLGMHYLIPLSMAGTPDDKFNILITSNIVPMFDGFVTGIWNPLNAWLRGLVSGGGDVVVLAGPVFDTNSDGVRDSYKDIAQMNNAWVGETPIPTHYFLVVQHCNQNQDLLGCDRENLQVVAYILPHTNGINTCDGTIDQFLETYQATVAEVERITGLHLLSKLEVGDKSEEDLEWLTALKMSREPFRA